MTTRAGQTITWDAENRPVSVSGNGTTTTFVYDGDGNRVQKVEGGETILYVNRFYEKNLTTTVVTTSYYLGGTLVAQRENTTLRYTHQDHLSGTSLMTDTNGNSLGTMKYYPYGSTRSGSVPTDELFTGQKLDGTGLYYYNARYYDPTIGRFISPDTIIPNPADPQSFNRYSYCLNNPLKYVDPSGHVVYINGYDVRYLNSLVGSPEMLALAIDNDPQIAKALASEEYSAYQTFSIISPEAKLAASSMEKATDYKVNIEINENAAYLGDLRVDDTGDIYTIRIHPDASIVEFGHGTLRQAEIIWDQTGNILAIHPESHGGFDPTTIINFTPYKNYYKVGKQILSTSDAVYYDRYIDRSIYDLANFIPIVGWALGWANQKILDQDIYFDKMCDQGYYPRKE